MRTRLLGLAFCVAITPMFATCGDTPVGPVGGEVVVLVEVGGQPLPALVTEAPGFTRLYRADTIRLGYDDRWERRRVEEFTTPSGPTRLLEVASDGTIVREGSSMILEFVCDDMGICVAPDRLVQDPMGYRIERPTALDSVIVFRYEIVWMGGVK